MTPAGRPVALSAIERIADDVIPVDVMTADARPRDLRPREVSQTLPR